MIDIVHHVQKPIVVQKTHILPDDSLNKVLSEKHIDEELETIKELGEGNFSFVRLCKSKSNKLSVVKYCVLSRISNWVKLVRSKIPLEIAILCSLNHTNITSIISYQYDEFFYMILFPWLPKMIDLFDFSTTKDYDEIVIKFVMKQLLQATSYMHSVGIVHRDIKDENVLIDSDHRVKIIDFGSAAFIDMGPFNTYQGISCNRNIPL